LDYRAGRAPHNEALCFLADPPKVEEVVAVMRASGRWTACRILV
jgi:hypothetical protein